MFHDNDTFCYSLVYKMLHCIYRSFYLRIGVVSRKFADLADQKEKWFGTKYKLEDIADEAIQVNIYLRISIR